MQAIDVEKYRTDHAFLRAMGEQTVRDFERFGYELKFRMPEPPHFEIIRLQLSEQLRVWCKQDMEHIRSLLYHIDVPEHLLKGSGGCADPDQLADVILKRELIKVVLRKLFSS